MELVRRRLTAFANDIPHHGIDKFGSVITLRDTCLVPRYQVEVQTLYEQRFVERREKPYQGQIVPLLSVTEANVDPMSFEFRRRQEFEPFQDEMLVDASQEIHDCSDCDKTGSATCPECAGEGDVPCPQCGGSTAVVCPQCQGRGALKREQQIPAEKRCYGCWGSGVYRGGILAAADGRASRCPMCYGRGFTMGYDIEQIVVPCNNCGTAGQIQCRNCRATGIVTCAKCRGATNITCPRCDGRTAVVSYLAIVRTLDPIVQTQVHFDQAPSEAVQALLVDRVAADNHLVCVEATETTKVTDFLAELPEASAVRVLATELGKLLATAEGQVLSKKGAIEWQRVEIRQSVAASIRYEFAGQQYEAWTFGLSMDLLPIRSPFSDLVQEEFESAITRWEHGEKRRAAATLCRCQAMALKDPTAQDYLTAQEHRISAGLKAAAATSATMVSATAKFLSGATKIYDTVDAVKNSVLGRLFSRDKGEGEMRG